jgi:hypothetical protein
MVTRPRVMHKGRAEVKRKGKSEKAKGKKEG